MPARALDTHYNGIKFRSRLEARWAVFFDTAGIAYLYELEGFDVGDGVWYLPDFLLKQGIRFLGEEKARQDVWVEIKPTTKITEDERQKIAKFVRETGKIILLIAGDPGFDTDIKFISRTDNGGLDAENVVLLELTGGQVGLFGDRAAQAIVDSALNEVVRQRMRSVKMVNAYTAARSARFDGRGRMAQQMYCVECGKLFQPRSQYHRRCYSCYKQMRRGQSRGFLNNLSLAETFVLLIVIVILLAWVCNWAIN